MSHVMRKPVSVICEQHPRSLMSAFIIRCLDSIMHLFFIPDISSLYIASVAAQADLRLPWSQTPENRFSRDEAHIMYTRMNTLRADMYRSWRRIVQRP